MRTILDYHLSFVSTMNTFENIHVYLTAIDKKCFYSNSINISDIDGEYNTLIIDILPRNTCKHHNMSATAIVIINMSG